MIKFEEHDGLIFKMLDKPVPLTADAEMPCLVRLIQDDSPMGRLNKRNYDESLNKIECATGYNKMLKMPFNNMPFAIEKFEIIGYPVTDGSKEWALYRLMQGDIVMGQYQGDDVMVTSTSSGWHEVIRVVLYGKRRGMPITDDDFLFHAEKDGWQIYHEPKPEQPKPKYQVGDWVEVKETATGEIEHHTVERINTFCPVSPEYLVDDVWFNHDGMEIIEFMYNHRRITRKLSPSEVVIPVNISGTVRQAYNEDGTINDEQFQLLPNGSWDGTEMFISFDALDTQTREIVEGLLEEQDEEKLKGENND